MQSTTHPLASVQRWMQAAMTHPAGLDAGAQASNQQAQISTWRIEDVIERSRQQSSRERLEIYAHAYTARLMEVLSSEFPSLQHALGEELFHDFSMGYLEEFPSTSYTLAELGRSFPEFLAASRPEREGDEPDWADFLIDLSRLERIYAEVFDGPGTEGEPPLDLDAMQSLSAEHWASSTLKPAPCLRLLTLRFPVHEYITAIRHQQSPEMPEPETTCLVISRREFVVRRARVSELEFQVLNELVRGATISDSLAIVADGDRQANEEISVPRIRNWFQEWFRAGYFISVADDFKKS